VYRVTAEPRAGYVNYSGGGTTQRCSGTDCSMPDVINGQILTSSVEVDATQTSGSTAGSFGIGCAYVDTGTLGFFVGLTISADGRRYAIAVNSAPGDTPFDMLKGGADRGDATPAINLGLGALNHLRADCGNQTFALYVNDHLVTTAELDEPLGPPDYQRGVALLAAPGPDENVVVDFDNLVVHTLTGEPPVTPEFGLTILSDPLTTDDKTWPTGQFANAGAVYAEAYTVTIDQPDRIAPLVPLVAMGPPDRVSVGVTVTDLAGDADQGAGVMCRVTPTGLYSLQVDWQGRYGLFKTDTAGTTPLVDWTGNDAVSASEPNQLTLECVDDKLNGFVNGVPVATATDSSFATGQYGLWVSSPTDLGDVPTTVQFTDFVVKHP
jgi:hypothetical protein